MQEEKYNELKERLSSSMLMKLDHLNRFLSQGKASVMIGAGFSKNAEMDSTVQMKDWNGLVFDFHKRLYSKDPEVKDLVFKSPIRLASLIEASFGRKELDELILNSLPDDRIFPSKLHNSLLKLPWRDVFTTNYDTLLEKAFIDSGRYYEVVTNKDTLLYKTSPRIIKLHGSFKDIRPFIMTEEDYRTYAEKYPEFVNTVRQALIEGTLCLIGFSGDDPNFLNWIGWLRDIMGKQLAPVYTIVFNKDLHSSEINLLKERGVEIINFAELCCNDIELSISESLEFFFAYLENERHKRLEWNGKFSNYNLDDEEKITSCIEAMHKIRTSYPGWVYLPENHFDDFEDMDSDFPFFDKKIKTLSGQQKVDFIYELDWRLSISLTPKIIDWYIAILVDIINDEQLYKQDNKAKIDSLKVSLLSIYRQNLDKKLFTELKKKIETSSLNRELKRKFLYEQSLYAISILDYSEATIILNNWEVPTYDYLGVLWKSSIYIEIDKMSEALSIINEALLKINRSLIIDGNSPFLESSQSIFNTLLNIYERERRFKIKRKKESKGYNFYNIASKFTNIISNYKEHEAVRKNHDFNIGYTSTSWLSGESGYLRNYSFSYRLILLHESVGYVMALPDICINKKYFQLALPNLLAENFDYALSIIIRTANKDLVKECITRSIIKAINRDKANSIFDYYHSIWEDKFKKGNNSLDYRLLNVVIPFLYKLSTKLSSDRIIKLFEVQKEIFLNYSFYYQPTDLQLIYNCLNNTELLEILPSIFNTDIKLSRLEKDLLVPERGYTRFLVSEKVLTIILYGLESSDTKICSAAYLRLTKIYPCLDFEQKRKADMSIYRWRNNNDLSLSNLRYSFNLLPCNLKYDNKDITKIIDDDITLLLSEEYKVDGGSSTIQDLENHIDNLIAYSQRLSINQHITIITKICDFFEQNISILKSDDSESFFGGLRRFTNSLFETIERYFTSFSLKDKDIDKNLIGRLLLIFKEYYENKCKCFKLYVLLSFLSNKADKKIKNIIDENFTSSNENLRIETAKALCLAAKHDYNIQYQVNKLIDSIELTQSLNPIFIDILIDLYINKRLGDKSKKRIPKLLKRLYLNIESFSIDEEYKTDLYYYSNKFAGALSVLETGKDMLEAIEMWKKYSEDENNFNDVRLGFERGIELMKP